jgi:hypothetical protein
MGIEPEGYLINHLLIPPYFQLTLKKEFEGDAWREDKDWSNPFEKKTRPSSKG